MRRLTLCFLVVVSFCASLAYSSDCQIIRNTAGFRDWKALEMIAAAYTHKKVTGDEQLHREAVRGLLAESRLINLDKGDKALVLKVDQLKNENGQSRVYKLMPGKKVLCGS